MKDRFEEFVKNNREEFNIHTPNPDLWKKIEKKKKGTGTRKIWLIVSRIAAVAIIFFLSYAYHEFRDYRKQERLAKNIDQKVYEMVPELKEAEFYYNNQVNLKLEELQPLFTHSPEIKEEVNRDLTELDSVYISLKQDLMDNIANDQVLEAMIQNYRLKLDILEDLLHEVNNENTYEKIKDNKKRI